MKQGMEGAGESRKERLARFYRNVNILGAAAMFGAGVVLPEFAPVLNTLAAINAAQALGAEAVRLAVSRKIPAAKPSPA